MSGVAHFFVVVGGSKIHERMAHFFIDIYILGLSGKLSGFYYTVYMLEQVQEKPECILLITKRLYRQTAQHFHTSSGCVPAEISPKNSLLKR